MKNLNDKYIEALEKFFNTHKYINRVLWFELKHKVMVKHLNSDVKPKKEKKTKDIFSDIKMPRFKI